MKSRGGSSSSSVAAATSPMASRNSNAVLLYIFLWFIVCNIFNISSKALSNNSHFVPSAFWNAYITTTSQLAFTSSLGALLLSYQHSSPSRAFALFKTPARLFILPGIALALANLSMHWALTRTSVGMFQTAKSASPFFTAFACHFLLRRRYTTRTYLSLLPIVVGLGFASVTDLEFEPIGTIACFFSATCQVFVNLALKSVLESNSLLEVEETGSKRALYAYEVQSLVSVCGLITLLGLGAFTTLFVSTPNSSSNGSNGSNGEWLWLGNLNRFLLANVVLYASESVLAYSVNARLSRLPYAVVDAVRRLSIVIMSNLFFHYDAVLDANRSLNLLAVLAVASGAITFSFVVQEEPPSSSVASAMQQV